MAMAKPKPESKYPRLLPIRTLRQLDDACIFSSDLKVNSCSGMGRVWQNLQDEKMREQQVISPGRIERELRDVWIGNCCENPMHGY